MSEQIQTNEGVMKDAFLRKAGEIINNPDRFMKPPGTLRVGLEMEAGLVGKGGTSATEAERDSVIGGIPFADVELGAAQIEWRTEPIVINQGSGLSDMIKQVFERDNLMCGSAHAHGLNVLRAGTNPFISITEIIRTNKKKYQSVPDFHNINRKRTDTIIGTEELVDVGDAAVVSLLNSLQCNIEAESLDDAVDMLNRSLMIGPQVVALSGNARFLAGHDTGFSDIRMPVWEVSHDTRTEEERACGKAIRVGLPNEYFTDVKDYFDRIAIHPFILFDPDHALEIGIGLFWQDARIKIIGDSAVVEFRPVSIQPTAQEDLAVMMFYIGRLIWSREHHESLMQLDAVKSRRIEAMSRGIVSLLDELPCEMARSREGLQRAGVSPDLSDTLFSLLDERIRKGEAPADVSSKRFRKRILQNGGDRREALQHIFNNLV